MATHPLALTLPLDDPARTAAQGIADRLSEGCPVARNDLLAEMTSAFGGSSDDGLWSLRDEIGRASCRERGCQYEYSSVVAVPLKQQHTRCGPTLHTLATTQ